QPGDRVRAVPEVLRVLGRLVRPPEAGLVDRDRPVVLGELRQVAPEVAPRRRAGPAAVQQDHRLGVLGTGLVVVQVQRAGLDVLAFRSGHQYIAFSTGSPKTPVPYMT